MFLDSVIRRSGQILAKKWVRLVISCILLGALVFIVDIGGTWREIKGVACHAIVVLAVSFYFTQAMAAWRWKLLLHLVGIHIGIGRALKLNFISVFASCFLPGSVSGDAVKIAMLAKESGKTGRVIASAVLDRVINTLTMFVLAILLLPRLASIFELSIAESSLSRITFGAVLVISATLAVWLLLRNLPRLHRLGLVSESVVSQFSKAKELLIEWRNRPMVFVYAVLLSVATFVLTTVGAYVLLQGLGVRVSFLDYLAVALCLHFIVLMPISLNGLGVSEVSTVFLLGALGVTSEVAMAYAILGRALYYVLAAPGLLYLSHFRDQQANILRDEDKP